MSVKEANEINGHSPVALDYLPSFLRRTSTPTNLAFTIPPHDLRPPPIGDKDIFYNGHDVTKVFWKGIQCPDCGKLNSRELFSHWQCFGCKKELQKRERTIYTAKQLADPDRSQYTGIPIVADWVKPGRGIIANQEVIPFKDDRYRCATYEFPKGGRVIHMVPSVGARAGCDEMFSRYQTQNIVFRRCPMTRSKGIAPY
jgi:hypothetical protein